MKNKFNIKKFTLIELIIVIVVIGILAGMALPKFIGVTKDAKVSAMDQDLDVLEKAVQLYESDNDGLEPFLKDGSGNYAKVSVTRQTLKDTLDAIGDDESSVYTLDMDSLKPYLQRLKYTDSTTDTYLYSIKTSVAINKQGKIDSSGITHHILNGLSNIATKPKITLMNNSSYSRTPFVMIDNGELYGCGNNYSGQIGDNTTTTSKVPINITQLSNVTFTQVAGGANHSMAIGSDGELYIWGKNDNGELGDGTTAKSLVPKEITLPNGVKPVQISAGSNHSMGIGSDGELYTWGYNYSGQIGDNTTQNKLTPTKITLSIGVKPKQIICGGSHSMAIGDDGELYAWGKNDYGQLGDGTTTKKIIPTKITLSIGVKPKQIVCGGEFSMAIGDDGNLYTWGSDNFGQLGNGTSDYNTHNTPIKISLPNGVKPKQIASGYYYSMTIGDDGNLYTWGNNLFGQIGDGTFDNRVTSPKRITFLNDVKPKQIACGYGHSMAIGDDNNYYIWGDNTYGQYGDGSYTNKLIPTKIEFNFK